MSGAELALAIVPLVLILIEHHPTVWRKTKVGWSSKSKNDQQLDFFQELHAELSLLHVTLDRVKSVSNARDAEEPLAEQIDSALGKNAPHFQQILDRVMRSVNDLVREKSSALRQNDISDQYAMLSRLQQLQATLTTKTSATTLRERFCFSKNEKTRNVAMKRIRDGVQRLERLLGPSTEMFDYRSRASRRKLPDKRMRRLSEDLYVKMVDKWPRACACRARHMVKLCLWNCCCADDPNGPDESLDMVFAIPFGEQEEIKWQESTIHIAEPKSNHSQENGSVGHVRFQGDPSPGQVARGAQVQDIDSQSFCVMLREAQSRNSSLQILFEDGKLWQKRSVRSCLEIGDQADISLKQLLGHSRDWRLREKSILAVVLAHAVLHCSEGPWLRADWSKEHVSFFRKDATTQPDLSRPFLTIDFAGDSGANQQTDLFMLHSNPALLSLGVLLLEIGKGLQIEDHWSAADLTDGRDANESTNLMTALRLLANSEADLVIGYGKAVKACLDWDTMNSGREDEDFGKRMYEYIVEPLENELKHGFDILPEQLGLVGMNK